MDFKPSRLGNHILSVQCSWMTISVQWKIVKDFTVMNVPTTNATYVITVYNSTIITRVKVSKGITDISLLISLSIL